MNGHLHSAKCRIFLEPAVVAAVPGAVDRLTLNAGETALPSWLVLLFVPCPGRKVNDAMPRSKTISDDEAVRAVGRVLLRVGPAHFTLADVATESGLSPATLVQRFGSKRGLVIAFAKVAAAEASVPFERARAATSSPLGALRAALIGASRPFRSRQEVANSLALLLDDITDDEMRAVAALHAVATEDAIRGLLDEAVRAAELEATDTAQLALCVQAAWNGAIIQWALRGKGGFEALLGRVLAPLLPGVAQQARGMQPPSSRRRKAERHAQ